MTIFFYEDGSARWYFYRRAYRKSRWRREGQRMLNYAFKHGYKSGLIGVI